MEDSLKPNRLNREIPLKSNEGAKVKSNTKEAPKGFFIRFQIVRSLHPFEVKVRESLVAEGLLWGL